MTKNTKLSAPWETYRKMLEGFFDFDEDVIVNKIVTQNGEKHIPIEVSNHKKFLALDKILTKKVVYGDTIVVIDLYDEENGETNDITMEVIKAAFESNFMVDKFVTNTDDAGTDHNYVVLANDELVQFFNDNMADYYGNTTMLPEEVAKIIFNTPWNIQFCTRNLADKG